MDNRFIIKIRGFQLAIAQPDTDEIEMATSGSYEYDEESNLYYIDYDETAAAEMDNTHTSIEIGEDYVSVQRTGDVVSDMLFLAGRKTYSLYTSQVGQLMIGLYTEKLDIMTENNRCSIKADYTIDINEQTVGKNKIEIDAWEAQTI